MRPESSARTFRTGQLIAAGKLVIGDGYRAKNSELSDYGLPFARAGNIDGGFHFEAADRIPEEGLGKIGEKLSQPGDVVFTSKGTVGRFAYVRESTLPFVFSPQLSYWRSLDHGQIDPRYLFYWMQGSEFWLQVAGVKGQTDMADYVSLTDQRRMEITLPEIPEQRAIAHILGTLDDKIELNRRMNETLEAMARALFKSWFVDFDPVRAKVDGRWQPGGSLPGLPAELYDLFPDGLVESELGEVPEGWGVGTLGNFVEAERGLSYSGKHLADSGVPMHNLNSILEGGGYKYEGVKFYAGEYRDRHRVSAGDLVVANTEQGHDRLLIGYAAIVPGRFGSEGIFSHHLYRVSPEADCYLSRFFLCHLFNSGSMQQVVSGFANGTTVNMLPPDALRLPKFVVPPDPVVARFTAMAQVAHNRQEELVLEARTLAALRDTLLPKLISGELRVKDTDRFTEAIA